ncbi:hypothetical protein EJ03DRAFT_338957 [Teratosphaeria nubilosa]|uniref:Flavin reductase like domain-containing protein n=1 Tax=Teratosphaeria nubilosa TaxID=161662 RepID=A0A6G1KY90_9PEZI|nr:hypothetical protein EJ03DRAFT_338957 [Teratosphaeria nubilosa]
MYRHDLARRRFYQAFYDWTLVTSPTLALEHRTCAHVYRRRLTSSAREWQAQSGDDITKHQRPSSQDADPPIRLSNRRPRRTSSGAASWLSNPVRSSSAKPSDSLQAWEEVIRYRSLHTILLEVALPVVVVAQLLTGRYSKGMRRLAEESGATIELGATYRTKGGEKELRSVAVSGTFEEVQKVAAVFQDHKTVKNQEVKAGMKSSGHRLSGNANVAAVSDSTTSGGTGYAGLQRNRGAELDGATTSTAATAVPGQHSSRQSRLYPRSASKQMKMAWREIAPVRDENNPSAQKLSCELPIPTPILHVIQKEHGEGLEGLMSRFSKHNVHIQLGDAEYVGSCRVPGHLQQFCETLLSSVIVTASDPTARKSVLDGIMGTYKYLTGAVVGRDGDEARAEIDKWIERAKQPWMEFWNQPVVSEEEVQSKDIEVGTFVVRQRPSRQPSAQPDPVEDYFAAAERRLDTWIVEIMLPQAEWDSIDRRGQWTVQVIAQRFGIEIEFVKEGFEAAILGSLQGKTVLARPAKLVGPLEGVFRSIGALVAFMGQPVIKAALGKKPKGDNRSVQSEQGGHEPNNLSTQSGSADQDAVKADKTPFVPGPAGVQLDRVGQDASREPEAPSEPDNVTTRLQVAGSTPSARVHNADKLLGSDGRRLGHIRRKSACKITRVGAEENGLFELTGTPQNVHKATAMIRDFVGTQKISVSDELAVIQAAEEKMQEDVKTVLRPLTHPVVIITSRMAMDSGSDKPQRQELVDQFRGVTVSSFNTVTLGNPGPPIVSFNLKVPSRTWGALAESRYMCVHILSATPSAAAVAQLFTKPYEEPGEPFKLLFKAGGLVAPKNPRDPKGAPEIWMAGVILARMKARLMAEKCIHVADHVVALAQVDEVEFVPEIRKETSDGSFVTGKVSVAEARRRVEEAIGLAYAKRGYRSLGQDVDAGDLPVVRPWPKDEGLAAGGSVSLGGMERADAEYASMSSSKELDVTRRQNNMTAPNQTGALGVSDIPETAERSEPLELPSQKTPFTAQPTNEPITGRLHMMEDLAKIRRRAAQDEENDYDLGFIKETGDRPLKLNQEFDSVLGNAGSDYTSGKRNEALLPQGTRPFSTVVRRRLYSTTTAPAIDEEKPEHKETPSKPADYVIDSSLLTQSINDFLGLPTTSAREIPPMRALLKAQKAAVQASQQLQDALSDGSLTPQQSLALETEIATNERKVAKQLALRANHDLKKMLDTGKVDFRRVGWLEQTVEKGMVVVVEEARLLRAMYDRGEIGEIVFEKAKKMFEARHAELNEGAVRLRMMAEEEDEGF